MHTNGTNLSSCTETNLIWSQLENGLFQTGVSIFILISGYFGIHRSVKRVLSLEIKTLFYAVLSGILSYALLDGSLMDLIKSFLPVSTSRYWFITVYMLLMIFAPYFNAIVERLERCTLEKLLLLMCAIFLLIPTFLYFHVMDDGGKGIANMLFLYLLGGYIHKYGKDHYEKRKCFTAFAVAYIISLAGNVASSYVTGGIGAHSPFSRDCSIFVVIEAVSIFLIFREIKFQCRMINNIAKHVVAVYMFESTLRSLIMAYCFDWSTLMTELYWPMVNIIIALLAVAICIIFDVVKEGLLSGVENFIINGLEKLLRKMNDRSRGLLKRATFL